MASSQVSLGSNRSRLHLTSLARSGLGQGLVSGQRPGKVSPSTVSRPFTARIAPALWTIMYYPPSRLGSDRSAPRSTSLSRSAPGQGPGSHRSPARIRPKICPRPRWQVLARLAALGSDPPRRRRDTARGSGLGLPASGRRRALRDPRRVRCPNRSRAPGHHVLRTRAFGQRSVGGRGRDARPKLNRAQDHLAGTTWAGQGHWNGLEWRAAGGEKFCDRRVSGCRPSGARAPPVAVGAGPGGRRGRRARPAHC